MGLDTTVQLVPNQNSLLSSWGLSPLFEEKRLPADSLNVNLLEWKTQATVPVQAPSFIGPTTFQLVSLRNVKAADETVSGGSKTRVLVLRLSDGSTTHSAIEMDPFLPVDQLMIGTKIEVRRATVIGPYMLLEKAHTTVKGGYIYDDPVVASAAVSAGIVNRMYTPLQKGPPAYVSWEQRKKSPKTVKDADQRQLVGELMLGSQAAMAAPSRNITLEGKTSVAAKVSSDKITQALPRPRKERKQPDPTFWDDAPPERGPQDRASPLTFLSMLPQEILDVSTVFGGAEVVEEVIEVVEEVMRTATKTAVPDLKVEVAEEVMTTAIKTAADLKVEEVIEVAEEVMTTAIKTAVPDLKVEEVIEVAEEVMTTAIKPAVPDLKVEEVIEVAEEVMTTAIKTAVPDLKVEEAEAVKAVMATAIKIKRSTIREVDQATQPAEVLPKVRYQRELNVESLCTHLSTVVGGTRSPIPSLTSAHSTSPSSTTSNYDFRSVKDFEAGPGVEKGDAHMGVTIRFMLYRSWLRWHLGYRKIPISQMKVALLVVITQLVTMVAITRYCPVPPDPDQVSSADALLVIPLSLVPIAVLFLFLAQIPTGFVKVIYVINLALAVGSAGYLAFSSIYYGFLRVRGHSGLCSDQSKGLGMMLVHSVLVFLVATIGFFYKKLAPRLAKYYFLRSSIFAGRWKFLAVSDVMLFVPSWDPPEEDLRTLHVGDKTFSVTKGLHIDCQKTGGWLTWGQTQSTITYVGEVDDSGRPCGFGFWKQPASGGETVVGFWRNGKPAGPYKSRESSTGAGFLCVKIGWVHFELTKNRLSLGVANVESSVAGRFYRGFPQVSFLYPPKSLLCSPSKYMGRRRLSKFVKDRLLGNASPLRRNRRSEQTSPGNLENSPGDWSSRVPDNAPHRSLPRHQPLFSDDSCIPQESPYLFAPDFALPEGQRSLSQLNTYRGDLEDQGNPSESDSPTENKTLLKALWCLRRLRCTTPDFGLYPRQELTFCYDKDRQGLRCIGLMNSRPVDHGFGDYIRRRSTLSEFLPIKREGEASPQIVYLNPVSQSADMVSLDESILFRDESILFRDESVHQMDRHLSRPSTSESTSNSPAPLLPIRAPLCTSDRLGNAAWNSIADVKQATIRVTSSCDGPRTVPLGYEELVQQFSDLDQPHLTVDDWVSMERYGVPEIVVYVHGYNNSHHESAQVLGQMAAFGNFPNYVKLFLFAWPGGNGFFEFFKARKAAEDPRSHNAMLDFLVALKFSGVTRIHFICHSMGARLFLRSFTKMAHLFSACDSSSSDQMQLLTVTLFNPEYYLEDFVNCDFDDLRRHCSNVTLFCDADDQALFWSEFISRKNALGRSVFGLCRPRGSSHDSAAPAGILNNLSFFGGQMFQKNDVQIPPNLRRDVRKEPRSDGYLWLDLDVIDTTFIDQNIHKMRHAYFSLNREILEDLRDIILTQRRASSRISRLDRRKGNVWNYRVAPSHVTSIWD